ncbi:hypothetical protein [Streptomyces cyaneofuscatus]|uniref:Uncharacterized protein n=1 Tax=Streptomyces cyaneofuscatus TaxID=66883 RepID=A0ABZ1EV23_9ACTN|nr:hypothetical protein [Streptomyces cyaneofuscatus]WSB07905.1 hypothetical protein OG849_11910 [Streptomyces cyaneofuscatus]WSD48562.1 hypothetical protein OG857_23495 [Streptomyces cyaneofuscatus]
MAGPAFSARSRALLLLAVLVLAGGSGPVDAAEARTGTALASDGLQSSGTVGTENAKIGEVWYFALPVPDNTSSRPIEITDVALQRVPAGIEVLGYGAYHLEDTGGLPLLARDDGGPHTPDFGKLKNYALGPVRVEAGESSDIFYLAELKITAPPKETARWCRFDYRQDGRAYSQTMDCEVELTVARST